MSAHRLHQMAVNAYNTAYAKYSNFHVGAAVMAGGKAFSGCNIENASYGATVCAERVAIWKAVSELGPETKIDLLCLVTKDGDIPCGMCLQVMSEFMDPETEILLCSVDEYKETKKLKDFLPHSFKL